MSRDPLDPRYAECMAAPSWEVDDATDHDQPIPPNDDGTPRQAPRTGNDPGRGGWVVDMDSAGYVRALEAENKQLRNLAVDLTSVRNEAVQEREWLRQRVQALEVELGLGTYDHPHVHMSRGGWINTYMGRKVYPLDLRPEDIDIRDIAHALALECRYANHTGVHYSVAQHSVHVSEWVPPEFALDGLLHDAEECYLGDVPRPLKVLPQFEFWRAAGKRAAAVIQARFGLGPEPKVVSDIDHMMCGIEATRFMNTHPDWTFQPSPSHWSIPSAWSWQEAEARFLARFSELTRRAA